MKTKYGIGDGVLVKGIVRRIVIDGNGEVYYDMEFDGKDKSYGFCKISERELIEREEKKL